VAPDRRVVSGHPPLHGWLPYPFSFSLAMATLK
jgi:hypothetical protein